MATLTCSQIITRAGLRAGDTGKATRALEDLNTWLSSQYDGFQWPFLMREVSGVSLPTNTRSLSFGAGNGGITEQVQRIFDPIHIYTGDFRTRADIRLRTIWGQVDSHVNNVVQAAADVSGQPANARLRSTTTPGKWDVIFDTAADRDYLLELAYLARPAWLSTSDIPLYPNDETLIYATYVAILRYNRAEEYEAALEILVSKVNEDRMKYGELPGINDSLILDSRVFR